MKEILNFAVIGCGNISRFHLEAINSLEEAKLVSVSDNSNTNLERTTNLYGVDGYLDYQEMLKRDDLDVVMVLTSSGSHSEIGMAAANAGKHVIVEKPIDVTLEKARMLVETCKRRSVKLSCIFQHRFSEPIIAAKRAIENGDLGLLNSSCCHTKWYRDQNYYDEAPWRGTWSLDGGGALMNQSIHYIDLMQHLMGPVEEVFGYTATLAHERIETEDLGMAVLKFESGALGLIEGTTSAFPGYTTRLDILGNEGSIIIENGDIKSWEMKNGNTAGKGLRRSDLLHRRQILDMIKAIKEDRKPSVDGEEAIKALEIVLAIYASAKSGKPIRILRDEQQ